MVFPIKHLVLKLDPFALGSTKRIIEELYLDMLQDVSNQKHLTKMCLKKFTNEVNLHMKYFVRGKTFIHMDKMKQFSL